MKITITKEFDNIDDALAYLQGVADPAPAAINKAPTPSKRGRRTKTTMPTPDGTVSQAVAPGRAPEASAVVAPVTQAAAGDGKVETLTPAVAGTATKDEALGALRTYFNTKGPEAAGKLLTEFGATRFSELDAKQYGAFVAKATV